MRKILAPFVILVVCSFFVKEEALAKLNFVSGTGYRIICYYYSSGSIFTGAAHSSSSPIIYSVTDDIAADGYWIFNSVGDGIYTIKNASTGQYITYDGERTDSKRYVSLTTEAKDSDSYWKITAASEGFVISRAADDNSRLNVRLGTTHIVGTYESTSSPSSNELFSIVDASGKAVEDITRQYDEGTYGRDATDGYWENNGLTAPVVMTTDTDDPVIYKIRNVRSGKDVVLGNNNVLAESSDNSVSTGFYFMETDYGINIYTATGKLYVSPDYQSDSYVYALSGTPSTYSYWHLSHSSGNNAGYAIRGSSGNYWNDYNQAYIGFYSLDEGSTFVFYSNDARHKAYLESQGYDFSESGTVAKATFASCVDSLLIGGKAPVYDSYNGEYFLPVTEKYRDGNDFNALVSANLKGGAVSLSIGDKTVDNGKVFNFGKVSGGVTVEMTVKGSNSVIAKEKLTFTFLPVVEIRAGLFSTGTYNMGTIRVTDPDAPASGDTLVSAGFRWRGATAAGMRKKSYAIKLYDAQGNSLDRSFLSMREDNNWILDAMAVDRARMRNRVSTDLWLDFSTPPYQSAYKKNVVNGTHGRFVELMLNGKYAGIYCMTEKVDRKQLQLRKLKEASNAAEVDTVRGVLYKSSSWSYSTLFGHEMDVHTYPGTEVSTANSSSEYWNGWEAKYPDLSDASSINWEPLRKAVNVAAQGNQNDLFNANVRSTFDLPVFRDYYLFIELMLASDNHGKNIYLYNYDITKYKKFSITPWDLDGTWGMRWDGSENTGITADATKDFNTFLWDCEHGDNTLYHYLSTYNFDGWNDSLAIRYAELRTKYFDADSLYSRFASYRKLFKDSGADSREVKRWNNSDGIPLDFDTEMSFLKKWIATRVSTLDMEYKYDPSTSGISTLHQASGLISATGGQGTISVIVAAPEHLRIYSSDGAVLRTYEAQKGLNVISGVPSGIYIVGGRKILVR